MSGCVCVCVFVDTINVELFEISSRHFYGSKLWSRAGSKLWSRAGTNSKMVAFWCTAARGWFNVGWRSSTSITLYNSLFTSENGGSTCDCQRCLSVCLYVCLPVCLSVCLSVSKITQKRVQWFGWHFACRQVSGHGRTDQLLSPIRVIVRMPEADCFIRYRMHCNAECSYVGKVPRTGRAYWAWLFAARSSSDAWLWGVETPLSEVNALYRVPF